MSGKMADEILESLPDECPKCGFDGTKTAFNGTAIRTLWEGPTYQNSAFIGINDWLEYICGDCTFSIKIKCKDHD